MAYSPVEQGRILSNPALGSRPAQMALAWLMRQPDVMVIPKAATAEHVRDNRAALDVELTDADLKRLDCRLSPAHAQAPTRHAIRRPVTVPSVTGPYTA